MRKLIVAVTFISAVALAGCTQTQQGAGLGTLIGAGTGAIIGYQSDHAAEGALIGAAVGAAGGALFGDAQALKYCPACGADYPRDAQYCVKDGTRLVFKNSWGATAPQQWQR